MTWLFTKWNNFIAKILIWIMKYDGWSEDEAFSYIYKIWAYKKYGKLRRKEIIQQAKELINQREKK